MAPRWSRRSTLQKAGTTVLAGFAGCGRIRTQNSSPVTLGGLLPLSGELETYGRGMRQAVQIAIADVNEVGGPLDRELALEIQDTETKPSTTKNAYDTLVGDPSVIGVIGPAESRIAVTIASRVATDNVVQITPSGTDPRLAMRGYARADNTGVKYAGRTAPNQAQQGVTMGYIINEYVDADSAAFLVRNDRLRPVAREASQLFDGRTLRIIDYDLYPTNDTLDRLVEGDPDAIGYIDFGEPMKNFLRKWSKSDYDGQWVVNESITHQSVVSAIPDIVEGMYAVQPQPAMTDGAAPFQQAFDGEPPLFAAHAYDAVVLQMLAIQRAGEATATAIAENLRAVSRPPGDPVTVGEFNRAKTLLAEGSEINYEGASSLLALTPKLEPLYRHDVVRIRDAVPHRKERLPRAFYRDKLY